MIKKFMQWMLFLTTFFMLHAYAATSSPIGFWKTVDDVTGKPKAIVQIGQTSNGRLWGRIIKIYPSPGKTQNEVCTACQGRKHNQPMVGMVILEGFKQNVKQTNEWTEGKILDPENGKTYHAYLRLLENGQTLNVRGYIGVPLFGRSQIWQRVTSLH